VGVNFIQGAISLGKVEVPSYKIGINLHRTYKKLPCKGDILTFYYIIGRMMEIYID
jgi:hypothetical protein